MRTLNVRYKNGGLIIYEQSSDTNADAAILYGLHPHFT